MKTLRSTARQLGRSALMGALCLTSAAASAWNATGHRLIAEIAWQQMDQSARTETARLLSAHPDADRWRDRARSDDPRQLFIEASTWPDEIRKDARFFTLGKDLPTPLLEGFPDMEKHSNWHTAPRPIDGSPLTGDFVPGQLDKRLEQQIGALGATMASPMIRAYALPWVVHLVGDGHQPLHLALRRAENGDWDRVGHGVKISNPFSERKPRSDLHEFWDDLPIREGLRGEALVAEANALLARHRPPDTGAPRAWLDESWRLARDHGYPTGGESRVTIDRGFFEGAKAIAESRIVAAGYRLADTLNHIFTQGLAARTHDTGPVDTEPRRRQ